MQRVFGKICGKRGGGEDKEGAIEKLEVDYFVTVGFVGVFLEAASAGLWSIIGTMSRMAMMRAKKL